MGQIAVTIAGRTFRMACGDGEEEHLEALARELDRRISALKDNFGDIGDQRLTTMTALLILDEFQEFQKKNASSLALASPADAVAPRAKAMDSHADARVLENSRVKEALPRFTQTVHGVAERLEKLCLKFEEKALETLEKQST